MPTISAEVGSHRALCRGLLPAHLGLPVTFSDQGLRPSNPHSTQWVWLRSRALHRILCLMRPPWLGPSPTCAVSPHTADAGMPPSSRPISSSVPSLFQAVLVPRAYSHQNHSPPQSPTKSKPASFPGSCSNQVTTKSLSFLLGPLVFALRKLLPAGISWVRDGLESGSLGRKGATRGPTSPDRLAFHSREEHPR